MGAITIKNLDVVFGDKPQKALPLLDAGKSRQEIIDETGLVVGVNNVSLTVQEGEICVLMGLSGSGKSSLLRAVNGLNKISRGALEVKDGDEKVDLAQCDKKTLRHLRTHRVSMVFQKFALMPWLTVLDNVAFGLELQGVPKAERRKKHVISWKWWGWLNGKTSIPMNFPAGCNNGSGWLGPLRWIPIFC